MMNGLFYEHFFAILFLNWCHCEHICAQRFFTCAQHFADSHDTVVVAVVVEAAVIRGLTCGFSAKSNIVVVGSILLQQQFIEEVTVY